MEAKPGAPGRVSVVIERRAGRVFVERREVALPPNEFRLFLTLAEAPGEAVAAAELMDAVWGQDAAMANNDLYWLVWKLRDRIGDRSRPRPVVANRKGHGYLIDVTVTDLQVVDVVGPAPAGASADSAARVASDGATVDIPVDDHPQTDSATTEDARVGEPAFAGSLAGEEGSLAPASQVLGPPAAAKSAQTRRRPGLLLAACLVAVSCAAGFAARALVRETAPPPPQTRVGPAEPSPGETATPDERGGERKRDPERRGGRGVNRPRRPSVRSGGTPVLAAPGAAAAVQVPSTSSSVPSGGGQSAQRSQPRVKPRPPELPPPPTRYLYHLYNSENGDHFVTTDGGAVTEHEAKGYEGGAIGRVYVTPEKDTLAIATNYGNAYIFVDDSPKTEPASAVVPLWYTTNNAGDFFYTTSKSEASQEGWTASLIGYVRTL